VSGGRQDHPEARQPEQPGILQEAADHDRVADHQDDVVRPAGAGGAERDQEAQP